MLNKLIPGLNLIVSKSFDNIALLAPHYSLYFAEVSGYRVSEINDQEIIVTVSGHLHVKLDSGSKQERPEDDGQDVDRNFPFETKIRYKIGQEFL